MLTEFIVYLLLKGSLKKIESESLLTIDFKKSAGVCFEERIKSLFTLVEFIRFFITF